VCLSVCLSQVGVPLERLNVGSRKQRHTIAQGVPIFKLGNRRYQTSPLCCLLVSKCVYALLALSLLGRLRGNITSSTKPEMHSALQCRQKMTEPRPQLTRTENFVKFRRVVLEICKRRDRHSDELFAIRPTSHFTGSDTKKVTKSRLSPIWG